MDSTKTLEAAKTDVFGKDPVLGTDGLPLERGVGSHWHRTEHIRKAHYHAADAWASCDGLVGAAKAMLATAERIAAAAKASIEAAAAAKEEAPVPADPKLHPDYKALKDQYDQAVAERDVLTRVPAATAHNVARDAAEQKLLDDYRAEQKRIEEAKAAEAAKLVTPPTVAASLVAPPLVLTPGVPPTPVVPAENAKLDFASAPGS